MQVFRVETADEGRGPYALTIRWSDDDRPADPRRHPDPFGDSKLCKKWAALPYEQKNQHHFCFESRKQFRAWFYKDEWLVDMHEAGCILATYEVDESHVLHGHAQCTFLKEHATRIATEPLV